VRGGLTMVMTAAAVVALAAAQNPPAGESARAELKNAEGRAVGQATLTETAQGVLIHVALTDVPEGTHAFHIHAVGKCEPPFTTAGGHFNPATKQHGIENAAGMHAGDLPNIDVPAGGHLTFDLFTRDVTLKAGSNSLFDADGSSIVIHQGKDDYKSDPAGNAGARIACGVVTK
jgi:superoxide dismutase, Cu-Zn family